MVDRKCLMCIYHNLSKCIFIVLVLFLDSIVQSSRRQVSLTWAFTSCSYHSHRARYVGLFGCGVRYSSTENGHTGVTSVISFIMKCGNSRCSIRLWLNHRKVDDDDETGRGTQVHKIRNALFRIGQRKRMRRNVYLGAWCLVRYTLDSAGMWKERDHFTENAVFLSAYDFSNHYNAFESCTPETGTATVWRVGASAWTSKWK